MAIVHLELPSSEWVDYRDNLKSADKFAVQDAIVLEYDEDNKRQMRAGVTNVMRNALLARIITAWSYPGIPVPAQNIAGVEIIGETMDIDDYNALAEAVTPLLDKVMFTSAPNQRKSGS